MEIRTTRHRSGEDGLSPCRCQNTGVTVAQILVFVVGGALTGSAARRWGAGGRDSEQEEEEQLLLNPVLLDSDRGNTACQYSLRM